MKTAHIVIQTVFATLAALALAAALGAAAFIYAGVFDVAATRHHSALSFYLLHYAMRRSVKARIDDIEVPPLDGHERLARGIALYRQHCAQCHGAPGVAPEPIALSMRPEPPNLLEPGRDWSAREIYWVIRHGVKMSGMPGWEHRLSDSELWDLTAFTKALPRISPLEYANATKAPLQASAPAPALHSVGAQPQAAEGNPKLGNYAIYQYMCATCHTIPGIVGANTNVGPDLADIARRRYIGGVLLNTPENMVRWLRNPQAIDPLSAMPDLGVNEKDARDIAAYLYTLNKK